MKSVVSVIGAILLGFGTIFAPKSDPDAHWSEPPHWVIPLEEAAEQDGPGEPIE